VSTTSVDNGQNNRVRWNSSVLDLFHSVRLTGRDGTVLEYIENVDTLVSTIVQTTYESDFLQSGTGRLVGFADIEEMSTADNVDYKTYIHCGVTSILGVGLK
jgi:hypothetical protein